MPSAQEDSESKPLNSPVESGVDAPLLLNEEEIKPPISQTDDKGKQRDNSEPTFASLGADAGRGYEAAVPTPLAHWRKVALECSQILAALATVGAVVVAGLQYNIYVRPRLIVEEKLDEARATNARLKCESARISAEIETARKEVARWHSHSFIVWLKDQCTAALAGQQFTEEKQLNCMVALFNGEGPAREWATRTGAAGTEAYLERLRLQRQINAEAQMKRRIMETGGGEMLSRAVAELPKQLNLTAPSTAGNARSLNVDRAIDAAIDVSFGPAAQRSSAIAGTDDSGC